MDIWIGTSGYSYRDWVGGFYPKGTPSNRMLAYYSRQFPLVELNFTFYRPPTPAMLVKLAGQTPAGFQFLVKLPRTISHERSTRDLPGFRQAVLALQERDRLMGLLCQLPQSLHRGKEGRALLKTLADDLGDLRLAVEFRHKSWATPDLAEWMADEGLDLVSVDAPKLPALFSSGLVQSGPRVYVRLHSRQAENWYGADAERYDYDYSDEELGEWVDLLAGADATDQALFLFNNCHRSQAAVNARRLATRFGREAPGLHVVEPFADPPPVQRTLFES
jgi:uncharacterized protein YecE (DUF72 family)